MMILIGLTNSGLASLQVRLTNSKRKSPMASITMTTSFLGGSAATTMSRNTTIIGRRGVVMAKATKVPQSSGYTKEESTKRRDLIFAVAAATVCSVAKIAMADEDPKRGTEAAKEKYKAICVSMPTARICHK